MHTSITRLVSATAFAFGAFIAPQMAYSGEQPNLMIVGEDADTDTVPRHSRVFNRVLGAFSNELQLKGFKVFDETASTMGITNPGRVRRTDAELIATARRVQTAPIDVITVFQIYAFAEKNPYAEITDLRMRISGRFIQLHSGQRLGNFEVSYKPGELPPLPVSCNRDCVLEHIGDQAKRIGADVASVLATKLDYLSPAEPGSQASGTTNSGANVGAGTPAVVMAAKGECTGLTSPYTLTFRGFSGEELTRVEEYLVAFKGYDHHRPVTNDTRQARYWYESCSDVSRLNRNLRLMMEQMGLQARIALVNNKFDVDKIGVPAKR